MRNEPAFAAIVTNDLLTDLRIKDVRKISELCASATREFLAARSTPRTCPTGTARRTYRSGSAVEHKPHWRWLSILCGHCRATRAR